MGAIPRRTRVVGAGLSRGHDQRGVRDHRDDGEEVSEVAGESCKNAMHASWGVVRMHSESHWAVKAVGASGCNKTATYDGGGASGCRAAKARRPTTPVQTVVPCSLTNTMRSDSGCRHTSSSCANAADRRLDLGVWGCGQAYQAMASGGRTRVQSEGALGPEDGAAAVRSHASVNQWKERGATEESEESAKGRG